MASRFYNEICNLKEEREVESVFNKELQNYYNTTIEHPFKCDGLIIKDDLKMLIEYKYDEKMKNPIARAKVLIQVVFYLKEFSTSGEVLPNVIFIGDINEVFILQSDCLLKYTEREDVDWNYTHSNAWQKFPKMVKEISEDPEINPYIFDINENFNFKSVVEEISKQCKRTNYLVKITEHNIDNIFEEFKEKIITDDKLKPAEMVEAFIGSIVDKDNYYKHPRNTNILITPTKPVKINGKSYDSFFSHFQDNYTPEEKNKFTAIADRLIEDTERRLRGDFFTPTIFADYANKMLDKELGSDWRNNYVVWDCCWGTGNLTRDYKFTELYASTLRQSELDYGAIYNPEAEKFQFDFLNDDINNLFGCKIPLNLLSALRQNKPIVFFINPPYATSSSNMGKGETQGKGKEACVTRVYEDMVKDRMQEACKNLFSQFIYRICIIKRLFGLNNIHIGLFCKPIYLSGTTFENFRKLFLKEFEYKDGIMFNASCFANVSDKWGINFTIWSSGESSNKNEFIHSLVIKEDGRLKITGTKTIYNTDGKKTAKDWIKEPLEKIKLEKIKKPTMSSALIVKTGANTNTQIDKNALGCYLNVGNDVYNSAQKVALFTSCDSSNANGISIMPENFERIMTVFAARRLVLADWVNDKDTFLIPDTQHPAWNEFVNDSIVYALFQSASQQSSLRNIKFMGKNWDIFNNFFFMSRAKIMELANNNHYDLTYNDARVSKDRFIYERLQKITLTSEAKTVLSKAIELTEKSFEFREMFNQEHPEYQIMNWDCGWYQIKGLLKEYFNEDLKDFSTLYKILSDKMRPMIYELGFLK